MYGHNVTIITDHAAMKAILGAPNLTGKHARWWSKVHGNRSTYVVHCSGKKNRHADCLSRQPVMAAPPNENANTEAQIAKISSEPKISGEESTIDILLQNEPEVAEKTSDDTFSTEQLMDQELKLIILNINDGPLPEDAKLAKRS